MAQNSLKATTGGGTQTTTQSPQASVGSGVGTAAGSSVQPGTTNTLLSTDKGGISLNNNSVPLISLSGTKTAQVSQFSPPAKHHTNPLLFGFAAVLVVFALAVIWATINAPKTTTE